MFDILNEQSIKRRRRRSRRRKKRKWLINVREEEGLFLGKLDANCPRQQGRSV